MHHFIQTIKICKQHLRIISYSVFRDLKPFLHCLSPDVAAKNVEVKSGTDTELTCIISGLTAAVSSVTWLLGTTPVSEGGVLSQLSTDSSQTATLLVGGSHVTSDQEYVCRVVSGEYIQSPNQDTIVRLSVYGEGFDTSQSCTVCF